VSGGVVLIDLDDTCVPDRAATEAAIADLLAELGLRADGAAVGNLLAAARARWQTGPFYQHCLYMGISSWEGLWVEEPRSPEGFAEWIADYQRGVWRDAGATEPDAVSRRYQALRAERCGAYPDVVFALKTLAPRHRLWLMTNGESRLQRRKATLAGLTQWFQEVFVSAEIGAAKPADAFFAAVESALDRDGEVVRLVLGDSVDKDIRPAQVRGWPAIFVQRNEAVCPAGGVPLVRSLADLPSSMLLGNDPLIPDLAGVVTPSAGAPRAAP